MILPLRDNNPARSTAVITIVLIAANVAVFLLQLATRDVLTYEFAMIPAEVVSGGPSRFSAINFQPHWVTLFTSLFLHGGWVHLLGNMLFLWIFGNNVEDTLGHFRFLVFYFVCGAAAGLTHLLLNSASTAPTLGASGAIAGVLGAYIYLFPNARVSTLVVFLFWGIFDIPASVVLGFWFLLQLLSALAGSGMLGGHGGAHAAGVAVWAHVGGFVAGYLLIRVFGAAPRREPPRRRPSFMDY